jgi:ubiquinone/menaquinone biosynthesis C-methylase UbiE
MHGTLKRLQEGRDGTGITLRAFRLNAAMNHVMFAGYRDRVYQRIVKLSGARPGDMVLDVGSSSGYLARRLAVAVGPAGHVTGVDPAEPAIAHAQRRAGPGMTFAVGIAQDLKLPDSSFDVVTCTLAMHHIPAGKRAAALAEMYRVTRPGGRLLVADLTPLWHRGGPTRRAGEAVGPLQNLASTAGYQIESTGKLPLLSYLVAVRPLLRIACGGTQDPAIPPPRDRSQQKSSTRTSTGNDR